MGTLTYRASHTFVGGCCTKLEVDDHVQGHLLTVCDYCLSADQTVCIVGVDVLQFHRRAIVTTKHSNRCIYILLTVDCEGGSRQTKGCCCY